LFDFSPDQAEISHASAASNRREIGKTAKMRGDPAYFCQNPDAVCATQPAPTRVFCSLGQAGMCGDRRSVLFFDSAETT